MPIDYRRYPSNWHELSLWIRTTRVGGRCECMGECGLHKTHPGPRRCVERNGEIATWGRGTIVLTVAHLCGEDCPDIPPGKKVCANRDHLKAMCQRCHLRYDAAQHKRNGARTRQAQKEHKAYRKNKSPFPPSRPAASGKCT